MLNAYIQLVDLAFKEKFRGSMASCTKENKRLGLLASVWEAQGALLRVIESNGVGRELATALYNRL